MDPPFTLEPRMVVYCGACGMPPEYCQYGPDYETHCLRWLKQNHPDLYRDLASKDKKDDSADADAPGKPERPSEPWTTEERLTKFYEKYQPDKLDSVPGLLEKYAGKEEKLFQALTKKYGPEPEDPFYADDNDDDEDDDEDEVTEGMKVLSTSEKKKRRGAQAKKAEGKVDTRVIIQKITRNRKKATTVVVGMDTVPGVKLKDASKTFSKRFAGSSSVKDAKGHKEIIIQGDHMEEVAEMIVNKFNVPSDSVYLDVDGEFVPYGK